MADYPISNVPRRIVYTGSAGVGPYAFEFEVLTDTDINVYKNDDLLTLTADYTVSISPTLGTGTVTLVVAATSSDRITIVGSRPIERSSDFTTGGDFFASTLNVELDSQTILVQQVAETAERAIKAPVTDPTNIDMTLPINTDRAGTFLGFDENGNPIPGPAIASVGTITGNIANINTVANNIADVNTVAGNTANINTVAGISGNVTTVAGISANVTSTANNETNINTVAGSIANVNTVSSNIANVNTVGANIANVNTVAGINADVTTLASISSDVTSVAAIDSDVTTVAGISSDVTSVAGDSADISTVAGISSDVTSVAGISANVTTVAGIESDVTTVATNVADVTNYANTYLGAKTADPTLRNNGSALQEGDLYFNTVSNRTKVYDGTSWDFVALDAGILAAPNGSSLIGFQQDGTGTTATTVENKLRQIINVKDFGAVGDGITDDANAINSALTYVSSLGGGVVIAPKGIYMLSTSVRVPSYVTLEGDGIDVTIFKLMDDAISTQNCVTNLSNTGTGNFSSQVDNTGNEYIVLRDFTADGNGRRPVSGASGNAIQLANVKHSRLERVKGVNGRLHCIDVASSHYQSNSNFDYYIGASFDVVIDNCVAVDPVNDDGITTHFSNNIIINNPQCSMSGLYVPSSTTQGLEIDDGTFDVKIFGGYIKGFTKGFQIKGHQTAVPAYEVRVYGLTVDGCEYNYDIQRGGVSDPLARDVFLYGCTSIQPKVIGGFYQPVHMDLQDYENVVVQEFNMIGDGTTVTRRGIEIRNNLNNSIFRNINFNNILIDNTISFASLFRIVSTAGEKIRIEGMRAHNCYGGNVVYATNNSTGISVHNVNAFSDDTSNPIDGVIKASNGVINNIDTQISNITSNAAYDAAIVDQDGTNSIAVPQSSGMSFNKEQVFWSKALSGSNIPTTPNIRYSLGWVAGNQNLGVGEGVGYGFKLRVKTGQEFLGAYIASYKLSSADTNTSTTLRLATRANADSGNGPTDRWEITENGALRGLGAGSPEGVVTAPVGSIWTRTDGGARTTLYVKESGTGNTGWVAQGVQITGTVSQSGGVPTGAIIERGSNANGEFVKFADGTIAGWRVLPDAMDFQLENVLFADFPHSVISSSGGGVVATSGTGGMATLRTFQISVHILPGTTSQWAVRSNGTDTVASRNTNRSYAWFFGRWY